MDRFYVGIDESGHFPGIYAAVFSDLEEDIKQGYMLPKRREKTFPSKELGQRDFSFLVFQKEDQKRFSKKEIKGNIIASLLQGKLPEKPIDSLEIFVDGIIWEERTDYARDMISEIYSLPKKNISIDSGTKYDKKLPIVNKADSIAYYLFKKFEKSPLEEMIKDPHNIHWIK